MVLNSVEFELHPKSPKASTLKTKKMNKLCLYSARTMSSVLAGCSLHQHVLLSAPRHSSRPDLLPVSVLCETAGSSLHWRCELKWCASPQWCWKIWSNRKSPFDLWIKSQWELFYFFYVKLPELILMSKMKTHWNRGWTCSGSVVI